MARRGSEPVPEQPDLPPQDPAADIDPATVGTEEEHELLSAALDRVGETALTG